MKLSRSVLALCVTAMVLGLASASSEETDREPTRSSIPYVATHSDAVQDMLWMANVGKDDVLYDLGSGEGNIVIAAVRDFDARRAVGVEIDPKLIRQSRKNAEGAGVADRVEFIEGDLFKQDFQDATCVALFLGHDPNIRLRPTMFRTLKPGTRIVSHQFGMGEWRPDKTLKVRTAVLGMLGIPVGHFTLNPHVPDYCGNERYYDTNDDRIHYWLIPAAVAGIWRGKIDTPDGLKDAQIVLHQRLSKVTGTFQVDGTAELTGPVMAELWGDRLRFSARPQKMPYGTFQLLFDGHVRKNTLTGKMVVTDQGRKRESKWQARREEADFTGTWQWPCAPDDRTVKLRLERCGNTYCATYLDGGKSIPVTDFYDHGGGLYFTLLLGRERHGGLRIAKDAGWLLGEGIVENSQLKGQIAFYPSGGMSSEDIGETRPPKPIIRDWAARHVGSSAERATEEAQQGAGADGEDAAAQP